MAVFHKGRFDARAVFMECGGGGGSAVLLNDQ
jgi:hypothetical protein